MNHIVFLKVNIFGESVNRNLYFEINVLNINFLYGYKVKFEIWLAPVSFHSQTNTLKPSCVSSLFCLIEFRCAIFRFLGHKPRKWVYFGYIAGMQLQSSNFVIAFLNKQS